MASSNCTINPGLIINHSGVMLRHCGCEVMDQPPMTDPISWPKSVMITWRSDLYHLLFMCCVYPEVRIKFPYVLKFPLFSLNRNFHCLLYIVSGPVLWQIVNVVLWQIWSGYRASTVESTCWLPSIHLIRWLSGTPGKKQSCGRSHTQRLLWASTLIPSHLQNLHVSLSPVCFL